MSPHEPPQAFVDNYIKLVPESDIGEFGKVLDMKVCNPRMICPCAENSYSQCGITCGSLSELISFMAGSEAC